MAVKNFHKNRFKKIEQHLAIRIILIREKKFIESHFEFLKCTISKNKLICAGKVKPSQYSMEYEIKIVYDGLKNPKVFVIDPEIKYNDEIHLFPSDKSLCLYHAETDDFYWDLKKHHLFDTIIPWTLEWFVYYELYLISGKWEHPYIDHKINK